MKSEVTEFICESGHKLRKYPMQEGPGFMLLCPICDSEEVRGWVRAQAAWEAKQWSSKFFIKK
jgi:hypothetical protein